MAKTGVDVTSIFTLGLRPVVPMTMYAAVSFDKGGFSEQIQANVDQVMFVFSGPGLACGQYPAYLFGLY